MRVTTYNTITRINFIGEITLERKRKRGEGERIDRLVSKISEIMAETMDLLVF